MVSVFFNSSKERIVPVTLIPPHTAKKLLAGMHACVGPGQSDSRVLRLEMKDPHCIIPQHGLLRFVFEGQLHELFLAPAQAESVCPE